MHQFASGPSAALGLIGEEPPLSPETVGRPGSAFSGAPVALKPIPTISLTGTARKPGVAPESRRLVVRLLGGEEIELGTYNDREEAMAAEVVAALAAAEASGEWPEIEDRFLRPGSIASIDIQSV